MRQFNELPFKGFLVAEQKSRPEFYTQMLTLPPMKNQLVDYYYVPMILSKSKQQQKHNFMTQIMLVFFYFTYLA